MSKIESLRPETPEMSLSELIDRIPEADFFPAGDDRDASEISVAGVTVASNDVDSDWVFVGVPGSRHGAEFASSAKSGGATVLVTDESGAAIASADDLPTVVVPDPRAVAAELAALFYRPLYQQIQTVGVTGTNGKTTTTYLTRAALGSGDRKIALLNTVEIDTGDVSIKADRTTHEAPVVGRALALCAQNGCEAAVVEVSSHALSLGRVDGIHFSVGIFTNLQHDHLDFHGDMESYLAAKAKLFEPERTDAAVVAVDDQYGRRLVRQSAIPVQAVQVLTEDDPQIDTTPLWRALEISPDPASGGSSFTLVSPGGTRYSATCPLPGPANVQDAALAIVTANLLGRTVEQAIAGVAAAPPVDGRSHWIRKPNQLSSAVMVDSGHTPEAVDVLLSVVRPLTTGRIIAVFGTDGDRDATKRAPLAQVFAHAADVLVITDENPRSEDATSIRHGLLRAISEVRPEMNDVVEVPEGRAQAIAYAISISKPGDLILITGKGGERVQEWNGEMIPFYDPDVAERALIEAGY